MKKENNTNQQNLEAFDAPLAAPQHHRVIFENERVRVMEFRVPPGDAVPVHTHRWTTVNYVFRLSDFLSFDANGALKYDSRTEEFRAKEGEVFCLPPFPPLHAVENIGTNEMFGISVELKD